MNLAWKLKRLRSMGLREIMYRTGQVVQAVMEHAGLGLARPSTPTKCTTNSWCVPLPRGFECAEYEAAADSILRGRYNVFAMQNTQMGFPPDWNLDPKTGTSVPLDFGATIDYRDEKLVGNIKYLWEPNRHLELVTLAQAFHLGGQRRFADACRTMVDSWIEQCPYMRGPNWTSSLELGIRLLNWSIAWHLLGGDAAPIFQTTQGAQFKDRWLRSIYQHCHFIAGHLSRFSSANNHILGEELGLFVASTTWPLWPESGRWRTESRELFEREALLQNAGDGVNREQGIWYHHEVADMMLIAALVGRANACEFSHQYWRRLEQMLEFIASIMDTAGHMPSWGDSDDAVMVRFCTAQDFDAYRSLLATGAVLFRREDFKFKARIYDEKSRWLLGDASSDEFASLGTSDFPLPVHRSFSESGYYILGGDFETANEIRIIADAGPLGYLSIAAHGHADALSFTLNACGREFLIDPGTFAYHTAREWREYFRGTSAHNTVRIDEQNQSVSGGHFLWTHHARATCELFDPLSKRQRFVGSHDGYLRLRYPATHRRTLTYDTVTRQLLVDDEVVGPGRRLIEMFWHFCEQCQVELRPDHALIDNCGVLMALRWPRGCTALLISGRQTPPLGWISRRFDAKVPCSTIVVSQPAHGDWMGRTEIQIIMATESARQ